MILVQLFHHSNVKDDDEKVIQQNVINKQPTALFIRDVVFSTAKKKSKMLNHKIEHVIIRKRQLSVKRGILILP